MSYYSTIFWIGGISLYSSLLLPLSLYILFHLFSSIFLKIFSSSSSPTTTTKTTTTNTTAAIITTTNHQISHTSMSPPPKTSNTANTNKKQRDVDSRNRRINFIILLFFGVLSICLTLRVTFFTIGYFVSRHNNNKSDNYSDDSNNISSKNIFIRSLVIHYPSSRDTEVMYEWFERAVPDFTQLLVLFSYFVLIYHYLTLYLGIRRKHFDDPILLRNAASSSVVTSSSSRLSLLSCFGSCSCVGCFGWCSDGDDNNSGGALSSSDDDHNYNIHSGSDGGGGGSGGGSGSGRRYHRGGGQQQKRDKYNGATKTVVDSEKNGGTSLFVILTLMVIVLPSLAILLSCHILFHNYRFALKDSQLYQWVVTCVYFPVLTLVCALSFNLFHMKLNKDLSLLGTRKRQQQQLHSLLKKMGRLISICLSWMFVASVARVWITFPVVRRFFGNKVPIVELVYFSLADVLLHFTAFVGLIWFRRQSNLYAISESNAKRQSSTGILTISGNGATTNVVPRNNNNQSDHESSASSASYPVEDYYQQQSDHDDSSHNRPQQPLQPMLHYHHSQHGVEDDDSNSGSDYSDYGIDGDEHDHLMLGHVRLYTDVL